MPANVYGASLWRDQNVLELVVTLAQSSEYARNHGIIIILKPEPDINFCLSNHRRSNNLITCRVDKGTLRQVLSYLASGSMNRYKQALLRAF